MLAYDQPIARRELNGATPSAPQGGVDMLQLGRLLCRRRIMIASGALICALIAVAAGKSLTPRFTATAELYVDPRELQLVDRELTPRAQDVSGLAMVVDSQARLMTSSSVLLQVIKEQHLDADPEFGGNARGLLARLIGLAGVELHGDTTLAATAALEALNRHITIRKTERSFVVDVEVWSNEPAKAAALANAIASTYLAESRASQANAARRATSDLSGRLKELQLRLRDAETTLATYKAQNNFVGTQDTLISDQQLSASNQRLAAARAQTMDAKARYDQIEATRRGSADAGAIAEALQSPTIANLRAQYAEARKRLAELTAELGPRHPALRQTEKQVDDLRRTIGEEIDRFAQSAKNDLIRARDYEALLNKALETQKRQSVEMSQASVRLREIERDVEASRDVYQSFLKRSRETEEQESLNTSAARIIGEATVPQRRSFPPAVSLLAMIGFLFGALAAGGLAVAVDRLPGQAPEPGPRGEGRKPRAAAPAQPAEAASPVPVPGAVAEAATSTAVPVAPAEKPVIVRLQESDILRTLGGILATSAAADVTRLGWPILRNGTAPSAFLDGVRGIRARLPRRASSNTVPVVAVIGDAAGNDDRSIAALNIALGCVRDGAKVLLIDADPDTGSLSRRLGRLGKLEPHRLGRLSIAGHASRAIQTANGISILPALKGHNGEAADAVRKALARARSASDFDVVILDGPAMPWDVADLHLLDAADVLVAVLPLRLGINESMEEIIAALGPAQDRLAGVVLNELGAATVQEQGKQYA